MVAQIQSQPTYSLEEYFELEAKALDRHEYINGEIIPMPGGTINHSRIIRNCCTVLDSALKRQPYETFVADQHLQIIPRNYYTYPDLMVVEGEPELLKGRNDTITNPTLIVEVLSNSTANYNRGEKFLAYRTIPTFQEYILIDQYSVYIEQYVKQDDRNWLLTIHDNLSGTINLNSVPVQISIEDIFDKVKFDSESIENETIKLDDNAANESNP